MSQANQYYQILAMDARGNVTQHDQHGIEVIKAYDDARGWQDSVQATVLAGATVLQDLSFSFDAVGNLTSRTDASRKAGGGYKNATENFGYDDLNRLLTVTGAGPNLTMTYDATGNITNKTGVGSYSYNSTQPHAVDSAGGTSYSYNGNGSMTGGDGRTIQYSVFNKPTYMGKSGKTVDIAYGPSRDRFRRVDNANQSSEVETHYLGYVERIYKPGGVVETKRYIDGEVIVSITEGSGAPVTTISVLLKDHLGSTHLLVSDAGLIQQAMSFDAWGQRRLDDDYGAMSLSQIVNFDTSITKRGFAGHEKRLRTHAS